MELPPSLKEWAEELEIPIDEARIIWEAVLLACREQSENPEKDTIQGA